MEQIKQNSNEISKKNLTNDKFQIILTSLSESLTNEAPQQITKTLLERSGISTKWNLLKWKATNLNSTIKKTNNGLNSILTGCIDAKTAKVLPKGLKDPQLKPTCSSKTKCCTDFNATDAGNSINLDASKKTHPKLRKLSTFKPPANDRISSSAPKNGKDIKSNEINHYSPSITFHSKPKSPIEMAKKISEINKKNLKSCAAHLADFQAERSHMLRKKFEWHRKQHERNIETCEKKLAIEEKWIKAESALNKKKLKLIEKEMERDEKLKILAMEKDERIRKYELLLKYQTEC